MRECANARMRDYNFLVGGFSSEDCKKMIADVRNLLKPQIITIMLHTNNNFELIPQFMPSLFIPKVFINITQRSIIKTFKKLNFGRIESVVMLKHTSPTGELYNSVIINIIWNTDQPSLNVRNTLLKGREINIMYDNPWFWKVAAYKIATIKNSINSLNARTPPPPPPPPQSQQRDAVEINENTDEFGRDIIRHIKKPTLKRGDDVCQFKTMMKRPEDKKTPINWADMCSSDDEDAELNHLCDLMPQLYIRPQSPDCPPPPHICVNRPSTPEFPPPQPQDKQKSHNRYFDIDNLNDEANRFNIDYSGALPVPKIKRRIVKK